MLNRVGNILSGGTDGAIQWNDVIVKLSGGKGSSYIFSTIIGLVAIIALGMALQWIFLHTTSDIRKRLINAVRSGKLHFGGRVLSRMLLDAMGVGIYILFTFSVFVLFYQEGHPNYIIVSVFLILSFYILFLDLVAKLIFAQKSLHYVYFQWRIRTHLFCIIGFFALYSSQASFRESVIFSNC